jgi:hypothetical protein
VNAVPIGSPKPTCAEQTTTTKANIQIVRILFVSIFGLLICFACCFALLLKLPRFGRANQPPASGPAGEHWFRRWASPAYSPKANSPLDKHY